MMMTGATHAGHSGAHRRSLSIVTLLIAAAALAACGQPDEETDSIAVEPDAAMDTTPAGTPAPPSPDMITGEQERVVSVRLLEWAVELSRDTVPAGQITFQAMNTGTRNHALEVEGMGVEEETETIAPGATASLTVDLQPGTYQVYCPVEDDYNHEDEGMTTTLVVTEAGG